MKKNKISFILQILFFTLISFILSYQLPQVEFLQNVEKNISDQGFIARPHVREFFKLKSKMDNNLAFLDIDGDALNEYGKWPWPRSLIGRIINVLNEFKAKSIMLDIEFVEKSGITINRSFEKNISTLADLLNDITEKSENTPLKATELPKELMTLDESAPDYEAKYQLGLQWAKTANKTDRLKQTISEVSLKKLNLIQNNFTGEGHTKFLEEFLEVIRFDYQDFKILDSKGLTDETLSARENIDFIRDNLEALFVSNDQLMSSSMEDFNVHLIFHFLQSLSNESRILSDLNVYLMRKLTKMDMESTFSSFLETYKKKSKIDYNFIKKRCSRFSTEAENPFWKIHQEYHDAYIQSSKMELFRHSQTKDDLIVENSQRIIIRNFININYENDTTLEELKMAFMEQFSVSIDEASKKSGHNMIKGTEKISDLNLPSFRLWETFFEFYYYKLKSFKVIQNQFTFEIKQLDSIPITDDFNVPIWPFTRCSKEIGFSNTFPDSDGVYRSIPLVLSKDKKPYYQAAFSVFLSDLLKSTSSKISDMKISRKNITFKTGDKTYDIPLDDGDLIINWSGKWNQDFQHISAKTLLDYQEIYKKFIKEIIKTIEELKINNEYVYDKFHQEKIRIMLSNLQLSINDSPDKFYRNSSIVEAVRRRIETLLKLHFFDQQSNLLVPFQLCFPNIINSQFSNFVKHSTEEIVNSFDSKINIMKNVRSWYTQFYYESLMNSGKKMTVVAQRGLLKNTGKLEKYKLKLSNAKTPEKIKKYKRSCTKARKLINKYKDLKNKFSDFPRTNFYLKNLASARKKLTIIEQKLKEKLENKIFFMGLTATGTTDIGPTPMDPYYMLVGIHINIINTLSTRNFIKKVKKDYIYMLSLLLAFFTSIVYLYCQLSTGFITMILGFLLYPIYALYLFTWHGKIIEILPICIILLLNYAIIFSFRYLKEERQKKIIGNMFSTMVSPEVLKYMQESPDRFRLTGEKKMATMFFSDVAGFTTISESLSAEDLAQVLNDYLTPMSNIILSYGGYIDKYEGDAIMADYGVPIWDDEDKDSHAWKACWAAIEQQEEIIRVSKTINEKYGVVIGARMGLNTGEVSAGNMGSETKFQYTVMGDAVNQAARFEPGNKPFGTLIMIGEPTYQMSKDKIEVRFLALMIVKGKTVPIKAYELIAKKGEWTEEQKKVTEIFHEGWQLHADKQFSEAIEKFKECLEIIPDDGPSKTYIEICENYLIYPPDEKILLQLKVNTPGEDEKDVNIRGEKDKEIIFGSTTGAFTINDKLISNEHMMIFWNHTKNKFYCKDLKSLNGTFINNEIISIAPIEENDIIKIGSTEIVVTKIIIQTWQGEWVQTSK
ncbi:CHASE2 domain-containing protein [bacterium]|nr:CHASE2 domain-containing protein [bacterium]